MTFGIGRQFLVKITKIWSHDKFLVKLTENKKPDSKGLILITSIWCTDLMSPAPFHALFIIFYDKKSFIYHFHLARIV